MTSPIQTFWHSFPPTGLGDAQKVQVRLDFSFNHTSCSDNHCPLSLSQLYRYYFNFQMMWVSLSIYSVFISIPTPPSPPTPHHADFTGHRPQANKWLRKRTTRCISGVYRGSPRYLITITWYTLHSTLLMTIPYFLFLVFRLVFFLMLFLLELFVDTVKYVLVCFSGRFLSIKQTDVRTNGLLATACYITG